MSSDGRSNDEDQPRREIHFNLATGQSNGKVSEANYDSPDEDQEHIQIQTKKVFKPRGESAKVTQQSPIRRNNYLLAVDNNDTKSKKPPNGLAKNQRMKEFPISATTFFKSPQRNSLGEKGFKFDSNSKIQKQQKKLGLTYQKPNTFGQRSQSAKDINRIKGLQRDPQDVAHSLHVLKIQYNNIFEDNTRLKTRNKNLEAVINTLYDDLNNQQQEIQKIYQGKQITPAVLITGSQVGLKRQLREERLINKNLAEELDSLKKSLKATNAAEQSTQIQFYQEECVRLRSMLELEIRQNKQTALTMIEDNVNVLTATTEEERKRILSELEKQNEELKFVHKQNSQLRAELDQARLKRHEAQKLKQMGDLQTRQAFLIKTKGQQIRTMEEQIQILNSKVENYDRLTQRNIELSKQVTELNHKLSQRNNELRGLKEVNLNKSQTMKLPNLQQSPGKKSFSPVPALGHKSNQIVKLMQPQRLQSNAQSKQKQLDESSQFLQKPEKPFGRQMSVPLEQRQKAQQTRPKDDFDQHSNKPSFHMDTSPAQNLSSRPQSDSTHIFKKIVISKQELCIRGINNFRALAEKREQPNNDIEMAFYKTYSKDIQQLYRKMQHQTLPLDIIKKLLDNRVIVPQDLNLQETARICAEKFSVSANELQVCEIILNHFIPCIQGEIFDLKKFYLRLEVLLNTHSENSMQSQEIEGSIQEEELIESEIENRQDFQSSSRQRDSPVNVKMFDSRERPMNVQVLSFQEEQENEDRSKGKFRNPSKKNSNQVSEPKIAQSATEAEIEQRHAVDNQSSEYSQPIDESSANSMSGHSGNMIDQIANMNNSITEEQMLDTAEQILNTLAQKLIENGWTVHDVFGQPEEIVRIIPEYENQRNIKVLSASNFLGRVYQVGIQNLTQLQVACLMRVLGKPEFDDSVRYDELELLLENFGVTKDQPSIMPDDNQDALLMEEEKVGDQIALGGSPHNQSGELSEEVVFIDDTKPVIEFPVDQNFKDQGIEQKFAKDGPEGTTPSQPQRVFSGLQNNQNANEAMETEEQKNVISPGLPISSTSLKRDRLKSATKNGHSRSDSAHGNTPTFVHLSAGPGTSGKNTTKSNQVQGDSPIETEDKVRNFTNQYEQTQIETAPKPAVVSIVNQSYQTSEQKESRQQISKQVLVKQTNERLAVFFSEVLSKISISELLVQVEKGGYKQQIKSKTTFTETSVINIDTLLSILESYSKTKLRPEELKAFQDCAQLTPKFSKIIAVKHFATFLKEVEQLNVDDLRSPDKATAFGRKDRPMVF